MQGLARCIIHSNVVEAVQRLDEMLTVDEEGETSGILLLLGLPRTGKNRVLNFWMHREHMAPEQRVEKVWPLIADVTIWRPTGINLGRRVYVTSMTCVAFSELAYSLGKISSQFTPIYAKHWYREPKSLYTDSQFSSLFSFVRSEVRRLRIRTIVIRNAHFIDARTLEMLMLLREDYGKQVSFVLSAQMQEQADLDEPLADAFFRVPHAEKICTRIELQRLTKVEYLQSVLPQFIEDLNIFFAEELCDERVARQIPHAFWQRTQHNWKIINDVAGEIRQKVPSSRDGKRVVTRAALEQILKCSFSTTGTASSIEGR